MRRIISATLFTLGFAGLLGAAETAPASAPILAQAPAATPPAAPAPAAKPEAAPAAAAPAAAVPAPKTDSAPAAKPAAAKPDTVPAAKPKKLSKKEKAKAAADSVARADSSKAAVLADSIKAAAAADSAKAVAVRDSIVADSVRAAKRVADSAKIAAADTVPADTGAAKGKKRKRIVRETTVNTIDELKGRYRSPKKALFMSLVVPGLGQAYVGQNWFNYTRAATYFLTDVGLAYGWHHYVVVRQDEQIKKYKRFADENWRQWKYEDSIRVDPTKLDERSPHRSTYCESVQDRSTSKGQTLYSGCIDPNKVADWESFKAEYDDKALSADSVAQLRGNFPGVHNFYEMIGKEQEFITGWLDANEGVVMGDSGFYQRGPDGNPLKDDRNRFVLATSPFQQKYIALRAQANDYARMQAWFLGGMVVNHIVSAIDAALTAHWHNKDLYQTEARWYDNLHLDSHIAWEGYAPVPTVTASLTF